MEGKQGGEERRGEEVLCSERGLQVKFKQLLFVQVELFSTHQ